jgi:hypothetical protein
MPRHQNRHRAAPPLAAAKREDAPQRLPQRNTCADFFRRIITAPFRYPLETFVALAMVGGGIYAAVTRSNTNSVSASPCRFFPAVKGNFTGATRVLIGEYHDDRQATNDCVNTVTQNVGPHTVLVEDAPSGLVVRCSDREISDHPNRTCIGWDSVSRRHNAHTEVMETAYAEYFQVFKSRYDQERRKQRSTLDVNFDRQMDAFIRELHKKLETSFREKSYEKYRGQTLPQSYSNEEREALVMLNNLAFFKDIQGSRRNGHSYQRIFKNNKNYLEMNTETPRYSFDDLEIGRAVWESNRAMVDTIRQQPGFTVVVAGKGHVVEYPPGSSTIPAARYLQEEMVADEDEHPYVILATPVLR